MSSGLYFGSGVAKGIQSSLDRYIQLKLLREERRAREKEVAAGQAFQAGERTKAQEFAAQQAELDRKARQEELDRAQQERLAERNLAVQLKYGVPTEGALVPPSAELGGGPYVQGAGLERAMEQAPEQRAAEYERKRQTAAQKDIIGYQAGLERSTEDARVFASIWEKMGDLTNSEITALGEEKAIRALYAQNGVTDAYGLTLKRTSDALASMGRPMLKLPQQDPVQMFRNVVYAVEQGGMDAAPARVQLTSAIEEAARRGTPIPTDLRADGEQRYRKKFGEDLFPKAGGPGAAETEISRASRQVQMLGTQRAEIMQNIEDIAAIRAETDAMKKYEMMNAEGYSDPTDMLEGEQQLLDQLKAIESQLAGAKAAQFVSDVASGAARAVVGANQALGGFLKGAGMAEFEQPLAPMIPTQISRQLWGGRAAPSPAGGGGAFALAQKIRPPVAASGGGATFRLGTGPAPVAAAPQAGAAQTPAPRPAEPGFGQPRRAAAPPPAQATAPIAAAATARSTTAGPARPAMPATTLRGAPMRPAMPAAAPPAPIQMAPPIDVEAAAARVKEIEAMIAWMASHGETPPLELQQELGRLQAVLAAYGVM